MAKSCVTTNALVNGILELARSTTSQIDICFAMRESDINRVTSLAIPTRAFEEEKGEEGWSIEKVTQVLQKYKSLQELIVT